MLFLIGAMIVYRIGTFIPVPGIDPAQVARFFNQNSGTIFGIANLFSGGALSRMSIFAMNVMPYISASIIIQMMSMVVPSLIELRKEGQAGQRKITEYTRWGSLILAVVQSFAAAGALVKGGMTLMPGAQFLLVATITMTCGTMFLMWLGEQITERGIGNGISMIILAGIVARLPSAIGGMAEQVGSGEMQGPFALLLIIIVVAVTFFVVFMESAQRRITVNYAKRQVGRRVYAAQSSHLPFKINMSGVIPPIFASSILLFPATIASFAGTGQGQVAGIMQDISAALGYGQPLHLVIYASLNIFFCFFYTALVFNSRDTADNLKKSGAFIPGIRPGQQTADYIDKVLTRLTLWGALYVA
ncbi:MAG: preprotein translocase subunit SecY, partial [Steroidobacteraceae bacterium]